MGKGVAARTARAKALRLVSLGDLRGQWGRKGLGGSHGLCPGARGVQGQAGDSLRLGLRSPEVAG
jgi:hypothetical protein